LALRTLRKLREQYRKCRKCRRVRGILPLLDLPGMAPAFPPSVQSNRVASRILGSRKDPCATSSPYSYRRCSRAAVLPAIARRFAAQPLPRRHRVLAWSSLPTVPATSTRFRQISAASSPRQTRHYMWKLFVGRSALGATSPTTSAMATILSTDAGSPLRLLLIARHTLIGGSL